MQRRHRAPGRRSGRLVRSTPGFEPVSAERCGHAADVRGHAGGAAACSGAPGWGPRGGCRPGAPQPPLLPGLPTHPPPPPPFTHWLPRHPILRDWPASWYHSLLLRRVCTSNTACKTPQWRVGGICGSCRRLSGRSPAGGGCGGCRPNKGRRGRLWLPQGFVCLMQISSRDEDFLIDTLALRAHIGAPAAPRLRRLPGEASLRAPPPALLPPRCMLFDSGKEARGETGPQPPHQRFHVRRRQRVERRVCGSRHRQGPPRRGPRHPVRRSPNSRAHTHAQHSISWARSPTLLARMTGQQERMAGS